MTIGWALFMWAAIIWLVPMMYFLMKNECKPKKNIILGVTLPLEAQGDGEVQAVLARFQREMKWTCWGVLALILPTLLIRDFGVFLTVWIVWIVLICFVLLLSCPLWGVWTIAMERAPVELILTRTELDGSHFGKHWTVALDDIDQVERLDTLPQLFRVAGTGMDSALTGTFRSDELGRLTCCLDPRTGPWLLVRTGDGYMFLFGSGEAGGVEAVLPALEKAASGSGSAGHRPS